MRTSSFLSLCKSSSKFQDQGDLVHLYYASSRLTFIFQITKSIYSLRCPVNGRKPGLTKVSRNFLLITRLASTAHALEAADFHFHRRIQLLVRVLPTCPCRLTVIISYFNDRRVIALGCHNTWKNYYCAYITCGAFVAFFFTIYHSARSYQLTRTSLTFWLAH